MVLRHKDLGTSIEVRGERQKTSALVHDCSDLEGHGQQQATMAAVGRVQTYLEGEGLWVGDRDDFRPDEA